MIHARFTPRSLIVASVTALLLACPAPETLPCSVTDNGDGTATISCPDGTQVTVKNGANGADGQDGTDGKDGVDGDAGAAGKDGVSCTVATNPQTGVKTISCTDGTSITVTDGKDSSVVDFATLSPSEVAALELEVTIVGITNAAKPVVTFKLTEQKGLGVKNLPPASFNGISLLKLEPGNTAVGGNGLGNDTWVSYLANCTTCSASSETANAATLSDKGDGSYTYTFAKDIQGVLPDGGVAAGAVFDANAVTRFAMRLYASGNPFAPVNVVHDYVPATGAIVTGQHEKVDTSSCLECHGQFRANAQNKGGAMAFHSGGRYLVPYCVVCHNDQRKFAGSSAAGNALHPEPTMDSSGNMSMPDGGTIRVVRGEAVIHTPVFIHKIHRGERLFLKGNYAGLHQEMNEIVYPQDLRNCTKCHKDAALADNWKTKPSRRACGSCHDDVDFATGQNHLGGARTDDKDCAVCHDASNVATWHLTNDPSPHNPNLPAGVANITYELKEVTVNASNQPVITFRVLKDGAPMDVTSLPTGLSGGPSFLVAYAAPQGANLTPDDWNQLGRAAGQPASISLVSVISGTNGTLSAMDADGYFTATLTSGAAAFPATATKRAVAINGYYSQTVGSGSVSRYTPSVIKTASGDTPRRSVVDDAKCGNCHEWLKLHGGNRVNNTAVCVVCHNPNLTSSGRGALTANISATEQAKLIADGYDVNDPLTFPEASNGFKDLIHGIHASGKRDVEYRFVRDRGTSGVYYYNWGHVRFPGVLRDCETCHKPGTYDAELPAAALENNDRTTTGVNELRADVLAARASVPNSTDLVSSPAAAACAGCHTSQVAALHMRQNGGVLKTARGNASTVELCTLCHGAGRSADVSVVHSLK